MANVIPMAGLGKRFSDAGFDKPKPLIEVGGLPMIVRAIRDMPPSDKWIFIIRKEHKDEFHVDGAIRKEIPGAIIIPIEKTTEGQACTCMLAAPHLSPDEPLFIASCDNGYLYDEALYGRLLKDKSTDCAVWTFTERETLRRNPASWGWCRLGKDGRTIEGMSIKTPLSDDPYHDHAVVGSFYFRRAGDFMQAVGDMIKAGYRIKNEFYVDAVPLFLRRREKKSVIFDVDLYIGWGTPEDLRDYVALEDACLRKGSVAHLGEEARRLLPLWKRYFGKSHNTAAK